MAVVVWRRALLREERKVVVGHVAEEATG